jgi:hypothetical protein
VKRSFFSYSLQASMKRQGGEAESWNHIASGINSSVTSYAQLSGLLLECDWLSRLISVGQRFGFSPGLAIAHAVTNVCQMELQLLEDLTGARGSITSEAPFHRSLHGWLLAWNLGTSSWSSVHKLGKCPQSMTADFSQSKREVTMT